MPLFGGASPFDVDIEKVTSENSVTEDWALILDICDKVKVTANGPKDCLKSLMKRFNHKSPHVQMQAATMLNACVLNSGRGFHLEICSRDAITEFKRILSDKGTNPRVVEKLLLFIKQWAEKEFRDDPALTLIPTMYNELRREGAYFGMAGEAGQPAAAVSKPPAPKTTPAPASGLTQQEQDDIARAIQLSLVDNQKPSLYPSAAGVASNAPAMGAASRSAAVGAELKQVKALYDFTAEEDNELTFKAGDVIGILDDSDPNWWKGRTYRGEGLFPASFVTRDLNAEIESELTSKDKTKRVTFNNEVEVTPIASEPVVVSIEEAKIDQCIDLLQNCDPTGELQPDPAELAPLEDYCYRMGPLIDQELEKIDRQHHHLEEMNVKVKEALQMYHNLMQFGLAQAHSQMGPPSVSPNASPYHAGQQPYYGPTPMPAASYGMPPTMSYNNYLAPPGPGLPPASMGAPGQNPPHPQAAAQSAPPGHYQPEMGAAPPGYYSMQPQGQPYMMGPGPAGAPVLHPSVPLSNH